MSPFLEDLDKADPTRDLAALEDALERLEGRRRGEAWTPEDAVRLLELCNRLSRTAGGEARRRTLIGRLAGLGLERIEGLPWEIEMELLGHLPTTTGDGASRRRAAGWWLRALRRLEADWDPGFDPDDRPFLNLAPPAETGLPSGVDPVAIDEPGLRARYEAALRANRKKTRRYNRQVELRRWREPLIAGVERFLAEVYGTVPEARQELKRLLAEHRISTRQRRRLLAVVDECASDP